jgi:oligoribonuclease NrnB/cAMP/cGMP phosphodiesterase (DHH superfamily)
MTPGRGHRKAAVSGEEDEEIAAFMGESRYHVKRKTLIVCKTCF